LFAIVESSSILCSRALLLGAGMDANESFVLNECATYRRLLHLFLSGMVYSGAFLDLKGNVTHIPETGHRCGEGNDLVTCRGLD
jgi:hypothetical protein